MNLKMSEIFLDKKNRNVYYNHRKEKAYLIPDKKVKQYTFFQRRILYALSLAIIITGIFNLDVVWFVSLTLGFYLLMTLVFYTSLLPKLEEIPNYNYQKSVREKKDPSRSIIIVKSILYFIAAGLIGYLIFNKDYDSVSRTIMIGFGIFSAFMGLEGLFELIKKK